MDSKKPDSKRAQLPRYYRSAYKVFFHEKRAEIINTQLRAYDEFFERPQSQVPVQSTISLPQLTVEINQMWKDLSPQERDKFKDRPLIDMKRKRAGREDLSSSTRDNPDWPALSLTEPVEKWSSFEDSYPNDGITEALDFIGNDLFDDKSICNISVDLRITHDIPWCDPSNVTPGHHVDKKHGLSILEPMTETVAGCHKGPRLRVSHRDTNPMVNDSYAIQQQSTPVSSSAYSGNVASTTTPPVAFHRPHCGAQLMLVHNSPTMPMYHPPSSFGIGTNPSSSITVASPLVPPTLTPTASLLPSGPNMGPSNYAQSGTRVGYNPSTSFHFPEPVLHSSPAGHGAPIYMYGYYPTPYFPPSGCHVITHPPQYYQTFDPTPMASTDSTLSSALKHSSGESKGAAVVDLCQANSSDETNTSDRSSVSSKDK